ncbi:MAG: hypothetical protein MK116_11930 [Phycisphaerales bacterium]|nr:hypothetical protein [Phycisphaerales bacterium]
MSRSRTEQMPSTSPRRKPARGAKFESDVTALEGAPIAGAWLGRLREEFSSDSMARGLEAARAGKVRRIEIKPGRISAQVRSEPGDTRRVSIHTSLIDDLSWDRVVEAMSGEAMYAACLLERQWPQGFDGLFAKYGMPLVPADSEPLEVKWDGRGHPEHWRAAAIGWLAAEQLAADPLLMLEIRGHSIEGLSDRLRQHRTLMTRGGASAHPDPPLDSETLAGPSLSECAERFWRLGPDFDDARRPTELDHIPHALLRRLGPSTMQSGRFPLAGLLATIYDTVADDARRLQEDPADDAS